MVVDCAFFSIFMVCKLNGSPGVLLALKGKRVTESQKAPGGVTQRGLREPAASQEAGGET